MKAPIPEAKDSQEVRVQFHSGDEFKEVQHSDGEHDNNFTSTPKSKNPDSSANKSRHARQGIACRMQNASTTLVFDTSCESSVIGGGAWTIATDDGHGTMYLTGPTPDLGSKTYPIADGVTAVTSREGTTLLLSV